MPRRRDSHEGRSITLTEDGQHLVQCECGEKFGPLDDPGEADLAWEKHRARPTAKTKPAARSRKR